MAPRDAVAVRVGSGHVGRSAKSCGGEQFPRETDEGEHDQVPVEVEGEQERRPSVVGARTRRANRLALWDVCPVSVVEARVDHEALEEFENLFRREYAALVAALAAANGDLDAADDAVQGAFVEAYDRWGKIRFYERPGAWVRRVAINRLIDDARRRSSRRRSRAARAAESYQDPDVTDATIRSAVSRLPERQRLLVVARYFDDLSIRQVAQLCDIAEGTVKSQLSAARQTLATAPEVQTHDR